MKYVLLIYQAEGYDPKTLSAEEHKTVAEKYAAINNSSGVRPGLPLGELKDAITVKTQSDEVTHASGPYFKQNGHSVGGYYEIEASSVDDAIRLASQIPAVHQGGAVEIRPSRAYW